jgi:hypothetical protein
MPSRLMPKRKPITVQAMFPSSYITSITLSWRRSRFKSIVAISDCHSSLLSTYCRHALHRSRSFPISTISFLPEELVTSRGHNSACTICIGNPPRQASSLKPSADLCSGSSTQTISFTISILRHEFCKTRYRCLQQVAADV